MVLATEYLHVTVFAWSWCNISAYFTHVLVVVCLSVWIRHALLADA